MKSVINGAVSCKKGLLLSLDRREEVEAAHERQAAAGTETSGLGHDREHVAVVAYPTSTVPIREGARDKDGDNDGDGDNYGDGDGDDDVISDGDGDGDSDGDGDDDSFTCTTLCDL
jgi:hypothetical protein